MHCKNFEQMAPVIFLSFQTDSPDPDPPATLQKVLPVTEPFAILSSPFGGKPHSKCAPS